MSDPLRYFPARSGVRHCESVSLEHLAAQLGTPTFVYSEQALTESFQAYKRALAGKDHLICVSVKANGNLSLLNLLAECGSGFDVVSSGELYRVEKAGGDPRRVIFAGVGKTEAEIESAVKSDILMFNVESEPELDLLNQLGTKWNKTIRAALRVNPDVDAKTHAHTNTGMKQHKFGIPLREAGEIYRSALRYPQIEFVGVDCHIGSAITDISVFDEAFGRIREFYLETQRAVPSLKYLDLGGGLSVTYGADQPQPPSIEAYGALVMKHFADVDATLILEPGRSIFGNAGVMLARVLFVKPTPTKTFVIADAGFNDLIRPLLYDAYHEIAPVRAGVGTPAPVDVVGPVCETGDCFAKDRLLPPLMKGDLIVFASAGAYGFSMSSNYNTRPRPCEVLVSGDQWRVVRAREELSSLTFLEEQALKERSTRVVGG